MKNIPETLGTIGFSGRWRSAGLVKRITFPRCAGHCSEEALFGRKFRKRCGGLEGAGFGSEGPGLELQVSGFGLEVPMGEAISGRDWLAGFIGVD